MDLDYKLLRRKMVDEQLVIRGIKSAVVLEAMDNVPRHLFVPGGIRGLAYNDSPLPIGREQTISQPYIVAFMTEQLEPVPGMRILEIGTGSGYQTAVLAYLGCEVYSIELLAELAAAAEKTLKALGYEQVRVRHGDGHMGWPEEAPFDGIIVTAAPNMVPERLSEQLKEGGKMIIPVGRDRQTQSLKIIVKEGGEIKEEDLLAVRFVPMVKAQPQ